jgi:protein-S-isoprenylcysteine O-methyltransferase Ste14
MQLLLQILVTALSVTTVGVHGIVGKAHFKSSRMPAGATLVTLSALTTLAVYLLLLWRGDPPLAGLAVGLVLIGFALWLFFRAIAASRDKRLKLVFDVENPVSLVTTGPYRYVRHPFYTSYLIFWTGLAVASWSAWSVPILAVMLALYIVAARGEEQKFARSEMAADYAAYRARTGMFVPRLGG